MTVADPPVPPVPPTDPGTDPGTEEPQATVGIVMSILGCPVSVISTAPDALSAFLHALEQEHCFDAHLQPALTATWLADLVARLAPEEVVQLTEPLGLRLVVLRTETELLVVGPYTARALDVGEAEAVFSGLGIGSAMVNPYKRYRSRFAIVDDEYALRGALALAQRPDQAPEAWGVRRVVADAGAVTPAASGRPLSGSADVVNQRYATEEAFMDAVAAGDERRALAALRQIANVPQPPGYLSTPYLGMTIMRIMTRIAARRAGLPAVTIDALSQTYAQRLHRLRHSPDPRQTAPDLVAMVSEFCQHVHEHLQRPFSRLVGQAIDEIELHLSENLSAAGMARRLHVSESQLARRFKAETGETITEHVTGRRVAVAARLLATTTHPVRDIAAHVGYLDANYFVKVFRSVHAMTPSEYRRRHAL